MRTEEERGGGGVWEEGKKGRLSPDGAVREWALRETDRGRWTDSKAVEGWNEDENVNCGARKTEDRGGKGRGKRRGRMGWQSS